MGAVGSVSVPVSWYRCELPPGVVFAAGVDEAAQGIGLRFDYAFTEAVGDALGDDGAIRQFRGGDQVVAVAGVAVPQLTTGSLVSYGRYAYATKSRKYRLTSGDTKWYKNLHS